LPPIKFEIEIQGKALGDLVFGPGGSVLVSEKFRGKYESHGLRGIETFQPVEIEKIKKGKRFLPSRADFFQIAITRAARIDIEKSGLEEPPECHECLTSDKIKRIKRIVLERDSWQGEDLFIPFGLKPTVLVSQKFKDFCDREKISNVVSVPTEGFSFDFFPWEKIGVKST
jgi:hypothetical protein